jgi:hypothetical protein
MIHGRDTLVLSYLPQTKQPTNTNQPLTTNHQSTNHFSTLLHNTFFHSIISNCFTSFQLDSTMLPLHTIKQSLIKGCSATSAERVTVYVDQVIAILGMEVCEDYDLFKWVVEAEITDVSTKISPGSVLQAAASTEHVGFAEVDRETLLMLLQRDT